MLVLVTLKLLPLLVIVPEEYEGVSLTASTLPLDNPELVDVTLRPLPVVKLLADKARPLPVVAVDDAAIPVVPLCIVTGLAPIAEPIIKVVEELAVALLPILIV